MNRKTRIRIWIVIAIVCVMCFSDWSFAADDDIRSIAQILDFMVSVLSWIWVVFANLAWKFLTNNWVYGEALWLDVLLWQYRNIVKNMANFCLGFYLVYVIFKWLIGQFKGKEDVMSNMKNVLLWVLFAWIWIQASWFLTSVVIDLSTITMSAVGAFPAQIVSNDEYTEEGIKKSMRDFFDDGGEISYGKTYNLFSRESEASSLVEFKTVPIDWNMSQENIFDALLPNKDDVSGPLYYMWFAILRTQEINSVKSYNGLIWAKTSILNLIIQWWTTIIYSIEIGILCVIALMRILYLWMFIVLSPLAILLACIKKAWENDLVWKWFVGDLMKQINLKTFLAKVFQPVIIVFWISLSMIFVTLISRIVNDDSTRSMDKFDLWWATITTMKDPKADTSDDVTYTTRLEWNLLRISMSTVWKWILDFMMSIITVILVYLIIDMSINIWNKLWGGEDFLSKKIESIRKWTQSIMTSIPLVPVAWYDKDWISKTRYISAGKVFGWWGGRSLVDEWIYKLQWKIRDKYDEQGRIVDGWFNNDKNFKPFNSGDQIKVENSAGWRTWLDILVAQFNKIRELWNRLEKDGWLKSGEWYGMLLNPDATNESGRFWQRRFEDWLRDVTPWDIRWNVDAEVWKEMVNRWQDPQNSDKTLEKLFRKDSRYVKAYAKLFELDSGIDTWIDLKNADISKK